MLLVVLLSVTGEWWC